MGIIKLKTRNTMKWSNRDTLKTWVWTDVKSLYQNDEKHSHLRMWPATVCSLSLVEMRKSICNLSSYLCIWRSARQCCHDLFYSDEAWCQNLCLAAKPHVKWPGGGLCVILWIAISSPNISQRRKNRVWVREHIRLTVKNEESKRVLRHNLRFLIPSNF